MQRIPKVVMVSYNWGSTPFVLRLCQDLAPRVGGHSITNLNIAPFLQKRRFLMVLSVRS